MYLNFQHLDDIYRHHWLILILIEEGLAVLTTIAIGKKRERKNNRGKDQAWKHFTHYIMVIFATAITAHIFSTTLWFPQDSRFGKNRQRGGIFKSLNFISDNEKTHFNRLKTLHSQLIRAKSDLNFFEKCLKHGDYPENLNVIDLFQVPFN